MILDSGFSLFCRSQLRACARSFTGLTVPTIVLATSVLARYASFLPSHESTLPNLAYTPRTVSRIGDHVAD